MTPTVDKIDWRSLSSADCLKIQTQYLQIWLAAHYSQTTVAQLNIFTVAEIDEIIKHHKWASH